MRTSPEFSSASSGGISELETRAGGWVPSEKLDLEISVALGRWRRRVPGHVPGVVVIGLDQGSSKARAAVDAGLEGAITGQDSWARLDEGSWAVLLHNAHSWEALDDRVRTLHWALEQAIFDARTHGRVGIGAAMACTMFSQSDLLSEGAKKAMSLATSSRQPWMLADRLGQTTPNGFRSRLANDHWRAGRPMFETVHRIPFGGIVALSATPRDLEGFDAIFRFAEAWLEGAGPDPDIHLHLSERVLLGTDPHELGRTLGRGLTKLNGRVVLEVTGRLAFHPRAEEKLIQVVDPMHLRLAFADFGLNRLDLQLLRNFPFETAKVDMQLLESIAVEPQQLAADLRRFVPMIVATGVADAGQKAMVTQLGFDAAQGPSFSRSNRAVREST